MSALSFYKRLRDAGVDEATAMLCAEEFDKEVKYAVDAILEPKRAKDRARKARKSTDSAETPESTEPLSLPPSPQTPQPPTHTRVSNTTREDGREDAAWVRFWADYPRKTAKAEARKAFTKAWKKLPDGDEEQILTGGLERAKASWVDAQFIPHAATWLNGERWNDEPPPPSQPRPANVQHHPHKTATSSREDRLGRMLRGALEAVDEHESELGGRRSGSRH